MATIDLGLVVPELDTTLQVSGKAADAKATGDALSSLSEQIVDYRIALNLLDNSDWRVKENIVNQRGQESYTEGWYTIDRWLTTSASHHVFVQSDGLRVVGMFRQYCLSVKEGKTYTIAAKNADGNLYVYSGVYGSGVIGNGSDLSLSKSSSTGYAVFQIIGRDTAWEWAALYEGAYTAETLPPYVPKGYAVELAECQMYYRKSFEGSTVPSYNDGAVIVRAANQNWLCSTNFEKPMRGIPTVTLYSPITKTERAVMTWSNDVDIVGLTVMASNTGFAITKTDAFDMNDAYCFHYIASADL